VSYYVPAADSESRRRPTAVTAASYLLYLVAALVVVSAVVSLATASKVSKAIQDAYADTTNGSDLASVTRVVLFGTIVVYLIVAILFVILGIYVGRGSNAMRITTWVVGGLGLLCFGCGAISGGVSTSLNRSQTPEQRVAAQRVQDAIPGWAHGLSITLSIVITLLLIAIIVLLALTPSNAYFRKVDAPFVPGYPSYPPPPGSEPPGGGWPTDPPPSPPTGPPSGPNWPGPTG
jgi:hypothetical protein